MYAWILDCEPTVWQPRRVEMFAYLIPNRLNLAPQNRKMVERLLEPIYVRKQQSSPSAVICWRSGQKGQLFSLSHNFNNFALFRCKVSTYWTYQSFMKHYIYISMQSLTQLLLISKFICNMFNGSIFIIHTLWIEMLNKVLHGVQTSY